MVLRFSDPITQKQKTQIMRNILDGLHNEIGTKGIVPDDAEAYTESVTLIHGGTGEQLHLDIPTGLIS